MVRLSDADLNTLLETLSDWEQVLQAENIDVSALLESDDDGGAA